MEFRGMGGRRPDRASAFRLCCSPNGRQVFLYDYSTLGAGLVLLLLLASRLAPTAAGRPRCPPLRLPAASGGSAVQLLRSK